MDRCKYWTDSGARPALGVPWGDSGGRRMRQTQRCLRIAGRFLGVDLVTKTLRVVITACAVGVTVAAAAAVAVDCKFQAIRSAPVLTYDSIVAPSDTLRMVARPLLMEETMAAVAPAIGSVPELALGWVLPREVALLIDPDVENATARVKLFVNEQRLGSVLHQLANDTAQNPPLLDWVDVEVAEHERGALSLEGTFRIDADIQRIILERWPTPTPTTGAVAPMEDAQPLAAVLGNRDGGALAVLLTLLERLVPEPRPYVPQALADTFRAVTDIRITANTPTTDEVRLNVRFAHAEGTPEEEIAEFAFLWDTLFRQMPGPFQKATGLSLWGSPSREGPTVIVNIHIRGLNKTWSNLCGEPS